MLCFDILDLLTLIETQSVDNLYKLINNLCIFSTSLFKIGHVSNDILFTHAQKFWRSDSPFYWGVRPDEYEYRNRLTNQDKDMPRLANRISYPRQLSM